MKYQENVYIPSEAEKTELFRQLLINEVGYKRANELYEAALKEYNPIMYAVQKAREDIEKR